MHKRPQLHPPLTDTLAKATAISIKSPQGAEADLFLTSESSVEDRPITSSHATCTPLRPKALERPTPQDLIGMSKLNVDTSISTKSLSDDLGSIKSPGIATSDDALGRIQELIQRGAPLGQAKSLRLVSTLNPTTQFLTKYQFHSISFNDSAFPDTPSAIPCDNTPRTVDRVIDIEPERPATLSKPKTQSNSVVVNAGIQQILDSQLFRRGASAQVQRRYETTLLQTKATHAKLEVVCAKLRRLRLRRAQRRKGSVAPSSPDWDSCDSDYATDIEDTHDVGPDTSEQVRNLLPGEAHLSRVKTSTKVSVSDSNSLVELPTMRSSLMATTLEDLVKAVESESRARRTAEHKSQILGLDVERLRSELDSANLQLRKMNEKVVELESEKTSRSHELNHFRAIAEMTERSQLEAQSTRTEALKAKQEAEQRLSKMEALWVREKSELEHKVISMGTVVEDLRHEREARTKAEAEAHSLRIELSKLQSEVTVAAVDTAGQQSALRRNLTELQAKVTELNERLQHSEPEVRRLTNELVNQQSLYAALESDVRAAERARQDAVEQREEAVRARKLLESTVARIVNERVSLKEEVLGARSQLSLQADQIAALTSTLNTSRQDSSRRLAQLEDQLNTLATDRDKLAVEYERVSQELLTTQVKLRETSRELNASAAAGARLEKESEALRSEMNTLQNEVIAVQTLRAQVATTTSELVALRSLAKQHESLVSESEELRLLVKTLRSELSKTKAPSSTAKA